MQDWTGPSPSPKPHPWALSYTMGPSKGHKQPTYNFKVINKTRMNVHNVTFQNEFHIFWYWKIKQMKEIEHI